LATAISVITTCLPGTVKCAGTAASTRSVPMPAHHSGRWSLSTFFRFSIVSCRPTLPTSIEWLLASEKKSRPALMKYGIWRGLQRMGKRFFAVASLSVIGHSMLAKLRSAESKIRCTCR